MPAVRRWLFPLALLAAGVGCTAPVGKGGKKDKSFVDKLKDGFQSTLNTSYHDPNADERMSEAEMLFADGRYADARTVYGKLADNSYNPTQLVEKARFKEAECCRMQNKLPEAVATYHRSLQDYPNGVYSRPAANAMFTIAEGWRKDIMPEGSSDVKQAGWVPNLTDSTRPRFDSDGVLMKTYEQITEGAPHAECAEKALFWAGYLHYARGQYDEADHFFSQLAEGYPDGKLRQEAVRYAIDAKSRVSGGPYYDGQKSDEALRLIHQVEASDPAYRKDPSKMDWLTKQKMVTRESQAERDFVTAEYYRGRGTYGSAYFYYELVKRRYPGTKWSDKAVGRITEMKAIQEKRDADKAAGKQSPFEAMQTGLDKLLGNTPPADGQPTDPTKVRPSRPTPSPIVPAGGFDGR
jgi:outer membrane protein assembly factor BamD (BamD/ComL family)